MVTEYPNELPGARIRGSEELDGGEEGREEGGRREGGERGRERVS